MTKLGPKMAFILRVYQMTEAENAGHIEASLLGKLARLGLFALSAYTTERRTKEIGIRKAMGADTGDILRLLIWQFTKPVLWANLIAWPLGWWALSRWLVPQTRDARPSSTRPRVVRRIALHGSVAPYSPHPKVSSSDRRAWLTTSAGIMSRVRPATNSASSRVPVSASTPVPAVRGFDLLIR